MQNNEKSKSKRKKRLEKFSSRKYSQELLLSHFTPGPECAQLAEELRVIFELASFQTPHVDHDMRIKNSLFKLYIIMGLVEDLA